ncbi:hypothetical protein SCP_0800780 [Sparassis crispa]|uniref:Uncharacterized protein n=1 Tax=Sparassis crispa TaxID=139825 RepID=A0A401GTK5_9APHY|nr:hypothetical protein SCP_0800780 [Sparassis crispa]GBE85561.1 hypothetical protein SCP_0800780 [Sparassis crispa]
MPVATRAGNADKHPGRAELSKRRSSKEVQAEKLAKAKVKLDKAESAANSVARIAMLEDKMAATDKDTEDNRVRALPESKATRKRAPLSTIDSSEAEQPPKKKKATSTRGKIQQARQEVAAANSVLELSSSDTEQIKTTGKKKGKGKGKGKVKAKAKAKARSSSSEEEFGEMLDWYAKVPSGWSKRPGDDGAGIRPSTMTAASAAISKKTKSAPSSKSAPSTAPSSKSTHSSKSVTSSRSVTSSKSAPSSKSAHSSKSALSSKSTSSNESAPPTKVISSRKDASRKVTDAKVDADLPQNNIVVAEKSIVSDDEDVERLHALSSPVKPAHFRAMNSGAIDIMEVNPDDRTGIVAGASGSSRPKPRPRLAPLTAEVDADANNPDISVDATPAPKSIRSTSSMNVAIADKGVREQAKKRKRMAKLDEDSEDEVKVELHDDGPNAEPDDDEMEVKTGHFGADDDEPDGDEPGKRKAIVKNADLPPVALKNDRWRRRFLPTVVRYVGTLKNPWTIDEEEFRRVLELIWDKVYGKLGVEYTDAIHVITRSLCIQRLYEWRSTFGSTAISVVEAFFSTTPKYLDFAKRPSFAKALLKLSRFAFLSAKGENRSNFTGLFRSPFMLRTFAIHLAAIEGAIDVEGLYSEGSALTVNKAIGALGLTGAAVKRSLTLYKFLAIVYKKGRPVPAKRMCEDMNSAADVDAAKPTGFTNSGWGHETKFFAVSTQNLLASSLAKVAKEGAEVLWMTRGQRREVIVVSSDDDGDYLVDNGESDENDDSEDEKVRNTEKTSNSEDGETSD